MESVIGDISHVTKRECLINGKKIKYDRCSGNTKEDADVYYGDKYEYIGSSNTYYINNTENIAKGLIHFYIKK